MKTGNLIKVNLTFVVFFIILSVYRFVALVHFKYIDFEDANIAIMARDIVNLVSFPLYAYGVPYNAGEVIDAFILASFFRLFGISTLLIKVLAVIESLLLVVAVYVIYLKLFNRKVAFVGSLLFSISPSIMVWNYYLRGYLIDTLFYFLVFYYFVKCYQDFNYKNIIVFGILSGISFWMKELVIILICLAWLYLIIKFIKEFTYLIKNFALYLLFFIIGYLPSIIYNLSNNFLNWKNLLRGGLLNYYIFIKDYTTMDIIKRFIINPIYSTILFFEPYNDLGLKISSAGIINWSAQLIFFFLAVIFIFKKKIETPHGSILKFIILYLLVDFILLTLKFSEPEGITGVRFYVLLHPLWMLLISYGIVEIHELRGIHYKLFTVFSIVIIIFTSIFQHINVYKNDFLIKEYEYVYPVKENKDMRTNYPVVVRAKYIEEIIKFLNENNIKYVFTTLTLKMRLLIETNFNLCVASYGYYPLGDPYPACRGEVMNSKNTAVIHLLNSPHIDTLIQKLNKINNEYANYIIGDYIVFFPVDMEGVLKNDFNDPDNKKI